MTKYTANQALQLLWVHHHQREVDIDLSVKELDSLMLDVVSGFGDLTGIYKEKLVTQNKADLCQYMIDNKRKTIFKG